MTHTERKCTEQVKCWVEVPADHWTALEHNAHGYDLYVKCGSRDPNIGEFEGSCDEEENKVFCDTCYMEKNPEWEKTGWRPGETN